MAVEWVGEQPEVDEARPPGNDKRRVWLVGLAALLAALGIGFALGRATRPTPAPKPPPAPASLAPAAVAPVSGVVIVHVFSSQANGNGLTDYCVAEGIYSDIGAGTPVLVTDVDQRFVGASRLDRGEFVDGACRFAFTLTVQISGGNYEFQIGNRVGTVASRAQLSHVVITYQ